MSTALLLIAHGSREPQANADLIYVAEEVRARGEFNIVETAFLEIAKPTIAEAAQTCIDQGAERIILVPYFLSAGVHVSQDLVRCIVDLTRLHPEVRFNLAAALGRSSLLVDLVIQRARESSP